MNMCKTIKLFVGIDKSEPMTIIPMPTMTFNLYNVLVKTVLVINFA
jgi:hypothetical protein